MQRERIIVVDSQENLGRVAQILTRSPDNFEIKFTNDPKEVLKLLEAGGVSIVICGANAPGIDCDSLPFEINKKFEAVDVIIFNMNGKEISREKFLRTTAFDIVQCQSPVCPEEGLLESVEIAVAAKKMRDTGSFKRPK